MKLQLAILLIALILVDLMATAPASQGTSGIIGGRNKFNRQARPGRTGSGSGRNPSVRPRVPRSNAGGHRNGGWKKGPATTYNKSG